MTQKFFTRKPISLICTNIMYILTFLYLALYCNKQWKFCIVCMLKSLLVRNLIPVIFITTELHLISFFMEILRNFHLTENFCNIQRHCVCIIKWNSSLMKFESVINIRMENYISPLKRHIELSIIPWHNLRQNIFWICKKDISYIIFQWISS